jgi:hypothetical protein
MFPIRRAMFTDWCCNRRAAFEPCAHANGATIFEPNCCGCYPTLRDGGHCVRFQANDLGAADCMTRLLGLFWLTPTAVAAQQDMAGEINTVTTTCGWTTAQQLC